MSGKAIHLFSCLLALSVGLSVTNGQTGLVGYWRLDETSGTTAADSTGNGNDGTLFGDVTWAPGGGTSAGALLFGGAESARVELPTAGMSPSGGTVAMWAYMTFPQPTRTRYLFGHTTQPPYQNRIQLYMSAMDTNLDLGLGDSHTTQLAITALVPGEWSHVALTWSDGAYAVYINGEEVAAGSYTGLDAIHDFAWLGNTGDPAEAIYAFGGRLDEVRFYDRPLTADEIPLAPVLLQASEPSPANGTWNDATWATLSWTPGDSAVSHDVYVGESYSSVNNGDPDTFVGNTTSTTQIVGFFGFPFPDGLVPGATYFWRVDAVDDADPASPWKGPVWNFTVSPRKAHYPNPGHGAEIADPDVTISWTSGFSATLHQVYFGDNFDDVNNGAPVTYKGDSAQPMYVLGTLEVDRDYYWRIDEFDGVNTYTGDVWNFRVADPIQGPLRTVITRPGDPIVGVPKTVAWPAGGGPENLIDDDLSTDYVNFLGGSQPVGFAVTPSIGPVIARELTFATSSGPSDQDPTRFEIYGSNDSIDGPYTFIASGEIVDFNREQEWPRSTRNETPIVFENDVSYRHYRILWPTVRNPNSANTVGAADGGIGGVDEKRVDLMVYVMEQGTSPPIWIEEATVNMTRTNPYELITKKTLSTGIGDGAWCMLDPVANVPYTLTVIATNYTRHEETITVKLGDPPKVVGLVPAGPDHLTEEFLEDGDSFDLAYCSLTFEPTSTGASTSYTSSVPESALQLPTDAAGGTSLGLRDDNPVEVSLGNQKKVKFFGVSYSTFWVSPNGYITFGEGDWDNSPTLDGHFAIPRISALYTDLVVGPGWGDGDITHMQLSNSVVVTWQAVQEFSYAATNTFQIEMFFNGTIQLSWLEINADECIVGLSAGGGRPANFVETNFR